MLHHFSSLCFYQPTGTNTLWKETLSWALLLKDVTHKHTHTLQNTHMSGRVWIPLSLPIIHYSPVSGVSKGQESWELWEKGQGEKDTHTHSHVNSVASRRIDYSLHGKHFHSYKHFIFFSPHRRHRRRGGKPARTEIKLQSCRECHLVALHQEIKEEKRNGKVKIMSLFLFVGGGVCVYVFKILYCLIILISVYSLPLWCAKLYT